MNMDNQYDVIVVGGGPAGYMAALRAARLGGRAALVEMDTLGGTCLNRGCIPTKTYLKTAEYIRRLGDYSRRGIRLGSTGFTFDMPAARAEKQRVVRTLVGGVQGLVKAGGIDYFNTRGTVRADKTVVLGSGETLSARAVIYAGGSVTSRLPVEGLDLPGVITSDDLLDADTVPDSMVIVGGGVIGVEMASAFAAFGCKITIVELADTVLPMLDEEISKSMGKLLEQQGVRLQIGKSLERISRAGGGLTVHLAGGAQLAAEKVLVAVGRSPDLSGVEELGLALDRGCVRVDEGMRSSLPWLYAPGDVNGRSMLAHAAFHMGEVAAANALGRGEKADLRFVPSCVYTSPEIGCVGLTEAQARRRHEILVGRFPFSGNGRALAGGHSQGFVKVVAGAKYGQLLGVHILGPDAAELINEAAALMAMEITVHELKDIIHGHPTFSEALMEAAADCLGECLHLPRRA